MDSVEDVQASIDEPTDEADKLTDEKCAEGWGIEWPSGCIPDDIWDKMPSSVKEYEKMIDTGKLSTTKFLEQIFILNLAEMTELETIIEKKKEGKKASK